MARRKRRKLYGAALKAHQRRLARGGRKKYRHRSNPPKAHKKRTYRKHRRTSARRASSAGRTLRYRRNPPSLKGITGRVVDGVKDAALVVVGEAGTNIVAGLIPFGAGSVPLDLAKKIASALVVSYAGGMVLSRNAAHMLLVGGLAGIVRSGVKQFNIPVLAPALADYGTYDSPLAVGSYPTSMAGISAYPQALMSGEDDDMIYS